MIIICEECGKKYQIDPSKIKGEGMQAKCRACGNMMAISRPETRPIKKQAPVRPQKEIPKRTQGEAPAPKREEEEISSKRKDKKTPRPKKRALGLRSKIFLLFFVVPIVLITGAGLLYLWQMNNLSSLITSESSRVVNQLAEQIIAEKARSVAVQSKLFLSSHSGLPKQGYNNDPESKSVMVQKVGLTGYTALYELPGPDGVWRTWGHANPKIIGIDMSTLRKPMGKAFPGFWRVFSGVKNNEESSGYYTWQDADGSFREKFMVCTPVEGTRFIIASTTYLDEFTKPMKAMEDRAREITLNTRNTIFGILAGTLLLIGVIVALYAHRLTRKIKTLTDVAERISVGEMGAEIQVESKDEIGDLAEAIKRMQESIRLSIERLRRRG